MDRAYLSGAAGIPPIAPVAPSIGFPQGANPGLGVPATKPGPWWYHMITEELHAIIAASGLAPDQTNVNQVLAALRSAGVFQTASQFDNDTSAATTAFVQRALGNFRGIVALTSNTTLTATDMGAFVTCDGIFTVTAPGASLAQSGVCIEIQCTGGAITIVPNASDTFLNGAGVTIGSLALNAGDTVTLTWASVSGWVLIRGSAQLKYAAVFGASLAASGYQKLPSGLIIQWGNLTNSGTAGNPTAVTFPVAFPNACRQVVNTANTTNTTTASAWYDTATTTGFNSRASAASLVSSWIAIGN